MLAVSGGITSSRVREGVKGIDAAITELREALPVPSLAEVGGDPAPKFDAEAAKEAYRKLGEALFDLIADVQTDRELTTATYRNSDNNRGHQEQEEADAVQGHHPDVQSAGRLTTPLGIQNRAAGGQKKGQGHRQGAGDAHLPP
jgi:hypothetical protein